MFCRIGVSEKGSATVKLSVTMAPGHSSMPPAETSIGILAAAVKRWEECFLQITYFLVPPSFNFTLINSGLSVCSCYILHFDPSAKFKTLNMSCNFLRLEENPMPRLFGLGPERGTFEHLAHKVRRIHYLSTTNVTFLPVILSDSFSDFSSSSQWSS